MIILFASFIILIKAQVQINPISGERFFYGGRELNQFGQGLNISQPNLGFQVQGGLIQGPLNTKINTSNILSMSLLEQYNTLAVLESGNTQYQISSMQYQYNGTINEQQILFNISNIDSVVCQQIQIIDYMTIIVHCINTTNNNVILYNYNQSQTIITQTQIFVNQSKLISVQIQQFDYQEYYNVYFIYIMQYQSSVYYCNLENNTYSLYEQVWSYNAQFLQIQITQFQEIFALQFNYLLYQYQQYQTTYAYQNNSNWLNMLVLEFRQNVLVYLINNYTLNVLAFESQFIPIQQFQFPFSIQNGQIQSNFGYTYVITNQFVLTYTYSELGNNLKLYQYNQYVLPNLTLYNRQQNILININTDGIQLYQLLDYYIFNNKPTQSGNITLNYYNQITQQFVQNLTIYVNVLSEFSNQICTTSYNFDGIVLSPLNIYYYQIITNYAEGSNLTYYQSSNISGNAMITNVYNFLNLTQAVSLNIYAIQNYNSLLIAQIILNKIYFIIYQYSLIQQQYQMLSNISASFTGIAQLIQFVEYANGTIMTLVFQSQDILVYEYILFQSAALSYTIDLNNVMSSKMYDISYYLNFYNTIFITSLVYEEQIILEIGTQSYQFIANDSLTLNYISGMKYDQNYIFVVADNQINIYVFDKGQITFFTSWQQPGDNSDNLYFFPLLDGYYVLYGSDKDMTLVYYDSFKVTKLGEVFNMTVNVTGYTFITDIMAYSQKYFYIGAQYNSLYYINIYQSTQSAINALYKSIWISSSPESLSVTSNSILQMDYLVVSIKSGIYSIYEIPHINKLYLFPQFQIQEEYNIASQIILNNSQNQINFTIQTNIQQPYLNIYPTQNFTNLTNVTSIQINPYQYFNGVIQNYSVACPECQEIQLNQIISDQFLEFDEGSQFSQSYIQDNVQYLYISTLKSIIQFSYNYSQPFNQSNYNQTGDMIVSYPVLGSETIYLVFLETNTNSISWISQAKTLTYINSILQNTTQTLNVSLQNISGEIVSANYYSGIIQIVTESFYYCYYYSIVNQTIQLQTVVTNLEIKPVNDFQISFILTYFTQENFVFGIIYQIITSTLKMLLLDVSVEDNQITLNKYSQINLLDVLEQQILPIQNIVQFGLPIQTQEYSIINLIYTNMIDSGTLQLYFIGLELSYYQEVCKLQLFNASYQQQFNNLIDVYGNQVAILNVQQSKGDYQVMLSLFIVSGENCQDQSTIQPYSYQLLQSNSSLFPQLNFLNSNQLLLSYNENTVIYDINEYLEINYVTDVNTTITLTAFNSIGQSNQTINVYFIPQNNNTDNNNTTPNNTTPNNTTPNNNTPNNTTPNNTTPNNTTPNNTTPNNTTPNNTTPNNTSPNNTTPNNTTPNNTTPNNTTPNNTTPNNTVPNNTTPNNTIPNNTAPNNTEPNNDNKKSTHLKWYWILLITILTLFIVVIIIVGIYFKFYRKENNSDYFKNDQEIEIKTKSSLQTT